MKHTLIIRRIIFFKLVAHLNNTTLIVTDINCSTFEPEHNKINEMTHAPSEDSYQPGHPPSLNSLRCAFCE